MSPRPGLAGLRVNDLEGPVDDPKPSPRGQLGPDQVTGESLAIIDHFKDIPGARQEAVRPLQLRRAGTSLCGHGQAQQDGRNTKFIMAGLSPEVKSEVWYR